MYMTVRATHLDYITILFQRGTLVEYLIHVFQNLLQP